MKNKYENTKKNGLSEIVFVDAQEMDYLGFWGDSILLFVQKANFKKE